MKNPRRWTDTFFILALVTRCYPLNHASHCMTISRTTVPTHRTARVSPAMHSQPQPSHFWAWGLAKNMLATLSMVGHHKVSSYLYTFNLCIIVNHTPHMKITVWKCTYMLLPQYLYMYLQVPPCRTCCQCEQVSATQQQWTPSADMKWRSRLRLPL